MLGAHLTHIVFVVEEEVRVVLTRAMFPYLTDVSVHDSVLSHSERTGHGPRKTTPTNPSADRRAIREIVSRRRGLQGLLGRAPLAARRLLPALWQSGCI